MFKEREHLIQYLSWGQIVRLYVQTSVLTSVLEPLAQRIPPSRLCLRAPSLAGSLLGDVQVDEQVWVGEVSPHRRHIGVFLVDLASIVAVLLQTPDKRRFARSARADHGDQALILLVVLLRGSIAQGMEDEEVSRPVPFLV